MGLEVIYGGCKDDKFSRELVVTARGDKLVVRKIFRKFTMSDAYKEKYPEAKEIDYTRNRYELLEWVESFDYQRANPKTAPMVTLVFEGQRYFYNKISGQWWDLPMLNYWNKRVFAMRGYDDDRRMHVALEYDKMRKYIVVTLNQKIVEKPIEPQKLEVYRNNDLILSKMIEPDADANRVGMVITAMVEVELDKDDIYCLIYGETHSLYDVSISGKSLQRAIPKAIWFRAKEFEEKHGAPFRWLHVG